MHKYEVKGIVADFGSDKWVSKTAVYEAASEKEALKKFRYDFKVKDEVEPKVTAVNAHFTTNSVVANAIAANRSVARNSASQVFAAQAASYFKEAFGGIQGCINCLERLRAYGQPDGFTDKDAEAGKTWADKVYDKVVKVSHMMKQGQINAL